MFDENKLKKVYGTLQEGGYTEDYNTFKNGFVGNSHYGNRKKVYDLLSQNGADIGDTYEEFMWLMQKGHTPMSAADRARFSAGAASISAQAGQAVQKVKNTQRAAKLKQQQRKQQNDFGRVDLGTKKTPFGTENAVRDNFGVDPVTGKVGTYITSSGEEIDNEYEAGQQQQAEDNFNEAYNTAVETGAIPSAFDVVDKNGNYDLYENVGKNGVHVTEQGMMNQLDAKIAYANERLADIKAKIAEIDSKNGNPLLSYQASLGGGSGASEERRQLGLAKTQVETELRSLNAVKKQPDRNFLQNMGQGFADTALTAKAWDFGLNDFAIMAQMEHIKTKIDNNVPLTAEEKRLAQSKVGADAAAALADKEMGKAYRYSGIAGQSVPFMLDFYLTGGFGGLTHAAGKAAIKYAAKKGMGAFGKNVLKYTGVTAANILGSYAMAGTEQAFKTGADIMNRHMGTLYQDEDGNYKFGTFDDNGNLIHDGGEGIGTALYKGLTAAMLENYTEKVFRHTHFKRATSKVFANHFPKFAKFIATKGAAKWMKRIGYDGLGEEIMEEEINIPLNALLVGDNKLSDITDLDNQLDIIFGIGLSVGSMYALNAAYRGAYRGAHKMYNTYQYYRFKNAMGNVDNRLQGMMGDRWDAWKEKIDNTPNEQMGALKREVLKQKQAGSLNEEEINTIGDYIKNLSVVRGYNLAKTIEVQAKAVTGEENTPEDKQQQEQEQAYAEGQNAEGEEQHEIQQQTAEDESWLASLLGVSEEQLDSLNLDSFLGESNELDLAIHDYQKSQARYQGVMDNAQSKVDAAEQNARAEVRRRTDTSRGTVRNATIKSASNDLNGGEDYGVFIVSGNVAQNEDGTINTADSDKMILYYDPLTGKIEHGDASSFASIGEEVDAELTAQQAVELARQDAISNVSRDIDGIVGEGSQFVVIDNQGQQHIYKVLADNGDGTASISIDGNVMENVFPSFKELQKMKDNSDKQRIANHVATRQAKKKANEQRRQAKKEADKQVDEKYKQIVDQESGMVIPVTVKDKLGNDKYVGSKGVFLTKGVSKDGKKAPTLRFVVVDEDGNITPDFANKKFVSIGKAVPLDEFKSGSGLFQAQYDEANGSEVEEGATTKEVEDSGAAEGTVPEEETAPEENEPQPVGTSVFGNVYNQFKGKVKEAFDFLLKHKSGDLLGVFHRDDVGDIDLVWGDRTKNQGIDHIIDKHIERHNDFGTLDEAMAVIDDVINNGTIDNKKSKWDKVVIGKDGYSVVIRKNIRDDKGNIVNENKNWVVTAFESEHKQGEKQVPSDVTLAAPNINEGSRAVAPDGTSEGKDNKKSSNGNEEKQTLTFNDGTPVPMLEDGNPDFSQMTAEQTAKLYDEQFGEDAGQIISTSVAEAKKGLDKAKNKTIKGKKFLEQKASKDAKAKAVAEAQAAYDNAKAVSNAYQELLVDRSLGTAEGRRDLLDKAKRKYDRLKGTKEWKDNRQALWDDTVGKVLHRLYDNTSVDVFDPEPQTVEEYVSSHLAPYSLNYEGTKTAKGVKQETGLERKDFAKSKVLAAEGKGQTVDAFVHKLWENRPPHLENVTDQEIRNAVIDLITGNMNAYDMRHVIENNRIAQAEKEIEDEQTAAEIVPYEEEQKAKQEEEEKKKDEENTHSEAFKKIVDLAKKQKEYWDNPDGVEKVDVDHEIDELLKTLSDEELEEISDVLVNIDEDLEYHIYDEYERREEANWAKGAKTYRESLQQVIEQIVPYSVALKAAVDSGDKAAIAKAQKELTDALLASNLGHGNIYVQLAQFKLAKKKDESYREKRAFIKPLTDAINAIESALDSALADAGLDGVHVDFSDDGIGWIYADKGSAWSSRLKPLDNDYRNVSQYDGVNPATTLPQITMDNVAKVAGIIKSRIEEGERYNSDEMNAAYAEDEKEAKKDFASRLADAVAETDTHPSEAQIQSGNYKKGHIKFGGYDFTIENPKGSERSGVDADGTPWRITMNNTYGYIRGKIGKDGDHLDMFINDDADLDNWNGTVYVVDQINYDWSFDEHKVMYGFNSEEEAKKAYRANYSEDWYGFGNITGVDKADFDKWLDSSKRKLKPFAEYASIAQSVDNETSQDPSKEQQSSPSDNRIFGEQLDESELRFSTNDGNHVLNDEERKELVEKNKVTVDHVSDAFIPKKLQRGIARVAKMMPKVNGKPLTVLYLYSADQNGWFDRNTNTLYLALDASEALQMVFGHEMTHAIKSMDPSAYNELKGLVKEFLGKDYEKAVNDTELLYNAHGVNYANREDYEEEVIADGIGYIINDLNLTKGIALRMSHPLLAAFHDVLMKIRRGFLYDAETYNKLTHAVKVIEKAYVDTMNMDAANVATETGEQGTAFSIRQKPDPQKTINCYKLMRLGEDGKLYPLFIDAKAPTELGIWYDGDSPNLEQLKTLPSGVHVIDNESGDVTSFEDWYKEHTDLYKKANGSVSKMGKYPSKEAINWATQHNARFVYIEDTKKGQNRFGGEARKYWNLGINGSGAVSTFSMRPGWHAGSLPTMRQIGKGKDKNLRDDNFVWVEGEISADIDYNEEAQKNPDKDIPDRIPTDGYYLKATNANKAASQADRVGWYVAGAFKANRIIGDAEARKVIDDWNANHPALPVEYDYERESGLTFNAESMRLEDKEGKPSPKFSLKVYHGSGADFDEFDFDHMGEGAGSQAFGWGGYVTTSKEIGKSYATMMDNDPTGSNIRLRNSIAKRFAKKYPTLDSFLYGDENIARNDKFTEQEKKDYYYERLKEAEPYHNMYEVNIPDDKGGNYLDWYEKPSKEVQEKILEGFYSLPSSTLGVMASKDASFRALLYDIIKNVDKEKAIPAFIKGNTLTQKSMYDTTDMENNIGSMYRRFARWFGSPKDASKFLSSLGYTGIKYSAGTIMGGAEKGDTNYVIFKPEDMQIAEHTKFSLRNKVDKQGNPINEDGSLKLDKVSSIDELTDDDFLNPTRNVELPSVPKKIAEAIGAGDKPIVVKKNIFERNNGRHNDVTPEQSRQIFKAALYNPDLYGQNQKTKRPYNWVLINTKDEKGKNRTILLEVNPNKDNVEIVHWYYVNDKNLELIKKQAIREGDQVLILPSEKSEEVGGLSNLTDNLSAAKINNSSETSKKNGEKFSLRDEKDKIISDAKKNGTYMKSPNGKDSKLSSEQWATVRTQNFKKWFGDWEDDANNSSKVVDENGEPMVVYHGRSTDFNTFEKKEGVRFIMGLEDKVKAEGFFFTPDKDLAEQFASNAQRHRGGKANIVPCFLNIRKPMDLTTEDYDKTYEDVTGWDYVVGMDKQDNLWGIMDEEGMAEKIKAKGYDGAIFAEELDDNYEPSKISYCALDPNQIKSADNNNGDFSADNNDIRFSLKETNDKFNSDLNAYIKDGIKPENGRFELGMPSKVLLDSGFPMLPISMRLSLLNKKAGMERHPFDPSDLYDMVNAIQKPIAVFEYSKPNMRNLIIDLTRNGKHFLVGVTLDYRKGEVAVNSISGLFPKENHEWIKWIQDGKAIRIDQKEKVLSLINSLRTNPEEAERIGLNLDSAAKIVNDFDNSKKNGENLDSDVRFSLKETNDKFNATNIDKEKALHFIEALPNHQGTTITSEELKSAAKVINNFETTKKNGEKFSLKDDDLKKVQLDIINKTNPMLDDYHTGIRKVEDINTFKEAYEAAKADKEKYGDDQMSSYPDETDDILDDAMENGEITIYSSKPIKNGNFVTPSRMQAEEYAGGGKVYEKTVPVSDVAWIDVEQGQYAKVDDEIKFSLAGIRGTDEADYREGNENRENNLNIAKKMEEEGKDAKVIKIATGWEKGTDDKWRYEISDADVKEYKIPDNVYEDGKIAWNLSGISNPIGTLQDIIDAPELFKYYPDLKDIKVSLLKSRLYNGGYIDAYKRLVINKDLCKEKDGKLYLSTGMKSTVNHEIQHIIQEIEGFAKGGTPDMFHDNDKRFSELDEKVKEKFGNANIETLTGILYNKTPEFQEFTKGLVDIGYNDILRDIRAAYKYQTQHEFMNWYHKIVESSKEGSAWSQYHRLAGETEARSVQARMHMTPEERRNSLASESEDVPRDQQILFGVGNVSFSLKSMADNRKAELEDEATNSRDDIKFSIRTFGTDFASSSDEINQLMNNEKNISRRIGSRAQAQSRVLATLSRASDEFRRSNRASARSGQDTWEKDRALGYVTQAAYGTGAFLTEDEIAEITSGKVGKGEENYVYLSKDGKTVIKLNNLLMVDRKFRFNEFVDRIKAHNEFAPEDRYVPLGFALNPEGDFCLVLEQPYVEGKPASQEEIDENLENRGFDLAPVMVSEDEIGAGWSDGNYEIWDTKPRNVLKDKNGDLHFIDTVIQHSVIDGHNDNLRFSVRNNNFDSEMKSWKKRNHLADDAKPLEKPEHKEGENIGEYAARMAEYAKDNALWKTAPKPVGYMEALEKWKKAHKLSVFDTRPSRPVKADFEGDEDGYNEAMEAYKKEKEKWADAPKPSEFNLNVEVDNVNKKFGNLRKAMLNQKDYDKRTVSAVSGLVNTMLNLGWGDGLSRGKIERLISSAKNATGASDVKKHLDNVMNILVDNYLGRLESAYEKLTSTKGVRKDQRGVIKIGELDAKGQVFLEEYNIALIMSDADLKKRLANLKEDDELDIMRMEAINSAMLYKDTVGGNEADMVAVKGEIEKLMAKEGKGKEDYELMRTLYDKVLENKIDRVKLMSGMLADLQATLSDSKTRAKEFKERIINRKKHIWHLSNLDMQGKDATPYNTDNAKKKTLRNVLVRTMMSPTYTFEQYLKLFGDKNVNGEGYLYNYFMSEWNDAVDSEQIGKEENRKALDKKAKELFGEGTNFMSLVGLDGKKLEEMDCQVTDVDGTKRTIHLKQGQMLYIYLVNKEIDGEMKLRAMGITDSDVAAIEAKLNPNVKAMGEWLQDKYLPVCQRRYQSSHIRFFGAPMKEVDSYFPLMINPRARHITEDVNQDSKAKSQLAGTTTGAIVSRRVNTIPLDIENADAFAVALNHLNEMEEWAAMLPFRQDINTLLSYTRFRNQVTNLSSKAYGNGEALWNQFMQCAQIAAGTYKPKVDNLSMDSKIAKALGMVSMAKISGRLWTAAKQTLSFPTFLTEASPLSLVRNSINPLGSYRWAMENMPLFRKRVESMTVGDTRINALMDDLEKTHNMFMSIAQKGMIPNIFVDAITCAVGARSVYQTEYNKLINLGYSEDVAEDKAVRKAVLAYNKSQQSSEGAFVAPMQVDRTYVSAALSLYKNSNYAYGRNIIEAARGLAKSYKFWGGHPDYMVTQMARQIEFEDGISPDKAKKIAKRAYNHAFVYNLGVIFNYLACVPIAWAMGNVLPYLLLGDDDDKKKQLVEEAFVKGFATSITDDYAIPFISDITNSVLEVNDGKIGFNMEGMKNIDLYVNPATSDLASMLGNLTYSPWSAAASAGFIGIQALIGFNPQTVGSLVQAYAEFDKSGKDVPTEVKIAILKALNAPEASIRDLYLDELGLNDKDAEQFTVDELADRYAKRRVSKELGLVKNVMSQESYDAMVDKYSKAFEKRIQDYIDKLDASDKKKVDAIYDGTMDPGIKDMIGKKRAKDAKAETEEKLSGEGYVDEEKKDSPAENEYKKAMGTLDLADDISIKEGSSYLRKKYAKQTEEYNGLPTYKKSNYLLNHKLYKEYRELDSKNDKALNEIQKLKEMLVNASDDERNTIMGKIREQKSMVIENQRLAIGRFVN